MGESGTGGREPLLRVRAPLSLCWYGLLLLFPFRSLRKPLKARGAVGKRAHVYSVRAHASNFVTWSTLIPLYAGHTTTRTSAARYAASVAFASGCSDSRNVVGPFALCFWCTTFKPFHHATMPPPTHPGILVYYLWYTPYHRMHLNNPTPSLPSTPRSTKKRSTC